MFARSPEQLREESKTLWYEFDQLCGTAEALRRGDYCGGRVVHNAVVEGFAMSARKIACFFFPHARGFPALKEDDLGASHYVHDWATHCPAPSPELTAARKKTNREVAHVTADRLGLNFAPGNQSVWDINTIEEELRRVLTVFLRHVPPTLLAPDALAGLTGIAVGDPLATKPHSIPVVDVTAKTCPPTEVRTFSPAEGFTGQAGD
jgi:hypothetical protein